MTKPAQFTARTLGARGTLPRALSTLPRALGGSPRAAVGHRTATTGAAGLWEAWPCSWC